MLSHEIHLPKVSTETAARVVGGVVGSGKGKAEVLLGVGWWVCFRLGVVMMKGRGGAGGRRGVIVVVEVKVVVVIGVVVVVVGVEV